MPESPRLAVHEGIENRRVIPSHPPDPLDRHTPPSRPPLKRPNGVHAPTVEVPAVASGISLGDRDDVLRAVQTARRLLECAERALHSVTSEPKR
jgi:hypothetical protein